jgi:hypothetical protein
MKTVDFTPVTNIHPYSLHSIYSSYHEIVVDQLVVFYSASLSSAQPPRQPFLSMIDHHCPQVLIFTIGLELVKALCKYIIYIPILPLQDVAYYWLYHRQVNSVPSGIHSNPDSSPTLCLPADSGPTRSSPPTARMSAGQSPNPTKRPRLDQPPAQPEPPHLRPVGWGLKEDHPRWGTDRDLVVPPRSLRQHHAVPAGFLPGGCSACTEQGFLAGEHAAGALLEGTYSPHYVFQVNSQGWANFFLCGWDKFLTDDMKFLAQILPTRTNTSRGTRCELRGFRGAVVTVRALPSGL